MTAIPDMPGHRQGPGRVWRFGADIDTDTMSPGAYMKLSIAEIAAHCLESVRPEFASQVRRGDLVAAGPNFGIGSSREQAAGALAQLGVRAVVAPSYSGLFFRNAFNLGLLLVTCPRAEELQDGEQASVDLAQLAVVRGNGERLPCAPIPGFLLDMVNAGGLLPVLEKRFARPAAIA